VEITRFRHEKTTPRMIVGVGVPESAILCVKLGVQNCVGPPGKQDQQGDQKRPDMKGYFRRSGRILRGNPPEYVCIQGYFSIL
jgi:hypothetical protein